MPLFLKNHLKILKKQKKILDKISDANGTITANNRNKKFNINNSTSNEIGSMPGSSDTIPNFKTFKSNPNINEVSLNEVGSTPGNLEPIDLSDIKSSVEKETKEILTKLDNSMSLIEKYSFENFGGHKSFSDMNISELQIYLDNLKKEKYTSILGKEDEFGKSELDNFEQMIDKFNKEKYEKQKQTKINDLKKVIKLLKFQNL